MNKSKRVQLNDSWIHAAFAGGLWASFEIMIGSFLHNIRMPFSGTILSVFSVILLIAYSIYWQDKKIIWRAGLICALMKSLSPSAVILGPLTGILMEAFFLYIIIYVFGKNYFAYVLGAVLSVSSALIHKIVSLLIVYGDEIVDIYVHFYYFAIRQIGVLQAKPESLLYILALMYFILGLVAASLGIVLGQSVKKQNKKNIKSKLPEKKTYQSIISKNESTTVFMLFIHIMSFIIVLLSLEFFDLYFFTAFYMLVYMLFCLFWYQSVFNRLKKPVFWVQLMILLIISALFYKNPLETGSVLSIDGFLTGMKMILRALFVVVSFSGISKELANPKVENRLASGGFKNLFYSMQISIEALPLFIDLLPKAKKIILQPVKSSAELIQYTGVLIQEYIAKHE